MAAFKRWNISAAVRKLAIWNDGAQPESSPSFSSGTAAPTAVEPAGSIYLRTNGGLYTTTGAGVWATNAAGSDFGATGLLTDVVAESTAAAGVTVDGLLLKDGYVFAVDNQGVKFGTGADIVMAWDATKLAVTQAAPNSAIHWGIDGAGMDHIFYGDTASASLTWDQSADALIVGGSASVQGLRTSSAGAAAITTTRVMTLADAGGVFSVSQAAAYDIDLPSPTTGPGCRYIFYLTGAAANSVTITVTGSAATFVGTIVNDVSSVLPATGATLTFVSGVAALGDTIEIISISTTLYLVRAVCSANGGITIT